MSLIDLLIDSVVDSITNITRERIQNLFCTTMQQEEAAQRVATNIANYVWHRLSDRVKVNKANFLRLENFIIKLLENRLIESGIHVWGNVSELTKIRLAKEHLLEDLTRLFINSEIIRPSGNNLPNSIIDLLSNTIDNCINTFRSNPLKDKDIYNAVLKGENAANVLNLIYEGANVNYAISGMSLLHYAAKTAQYHLIPTLINHGAELEKTDDTMMTPLTVAVRFFHKNDFSRSLRTVKVLLEKNANRNQVLSQDYWNYYVNFNLLHLAAYEAGSNNTPKERAYTELANLLMNSEDVDVETLDALLNTRIGSHGHKFEGMTARGLAEHYNNTILVRRIDEVNNWIINANANDNINIQQPNDDSGTISDSDYHSSIFSNISESFVNNSESFIHRVRSVW